MKRKLLFIIILSHSLLAELSSQLIRVGLFSDHLLETVSFHCLEGSYTLVSENQILKTINKGDLMFMQVINGSLYLNDGNGFSKTLQSLSFEDYSLKSSFSLKPVNPRLNSRFYEGNLDIAIRHGVLQIVNILDFDSYLAGVVEAEAGPGAPWEFFKAQSVLCRSYAVKNWDRHAEEGYNICDHTHCQAYHGMSDANPDIIEAVFSTHDIVIADRSYKIIDAVYHSNSGGETQKASGFWPEDREYLLAIVDPFSVNQKNYSWEQSIEWETWKKYFEQSGVNLSEIDTTKLIIRQGHRKALLVLGDDSLSMSDIRNDFGLKSAFFSTDLKDGKLKIKGKGYGHGLGLSQEGAMEMAKKGYSYEDIIRFYYNDIMIVDINDLPFNSIPEIFR